VVICSHIVGFESPARNATDELHLDGAGYIRDIRVGGWALGS
jgi:hypothetical protein